MRPVPTLRQAARSLLGDEAGNATIEFVLIAPALFYVIFTIGELGVVMTRSAMLDRGMSVAVRDLRLGLTPGVTHDQIKDKICDVAFLLGSCEEVLMLMPVVRGAIGLRDMPRFMTLRTLGERHEVSALTHATPRDCRLRTS